jgi:hypothetical protein
MKKQYYIVAYDKNNIPFLSIPTHDEVIDVINIKQRYLLEDDVIVKLEDTDKFIGW